MKAMYLDTTVLLQPAYNTSQLHDWQCTLYAELLIAEIFLGKDDIASIHSSKTHFVHFKCFGGSAIDNMDFHIEILQVERKSEIWRWFSVLVVNNYGDTQSSQIQEVGWGTYV